MAKDGRCVPNAHRILLGIIIAEVETPETQSLEDQVWIRNHDRHSPHGPISDVYSLLHGGGKVKRVDGHGRKGPVMDNHPS